MSDKIELGESPGTPEDVVQSLRESFQSAVELNPRAFIMFYEFGDNKIRVQAAGSPIDLATLHEVGTQQFVDMLRRSLHPSNKAG